ncbi:MAG: metalloregulator ArsR/SmtB family transcription factor [Nocardiopsaceae bacterium]|nr:metalloregulator ArsR/SmtB family transcription factor [Nocardiopsaceae bacterium]
MDSNSSGELAVAQLFDALADPTRRRVVEMLGSKPARAGELAAAIGTSAPVMSKHLRHLLRAGLVADERDSADARARVFRLRPQSVAAIQAWIDQLQAHWDLQLRSFQRHLEKEQRQ